VDNISEVPEDAEVWIINTNSRSVSENKAARKVKKAGKYLEDWNAEFFYKKIDSTLRGNIGAELEALAEELEVDAIPVCAAFPDMGRTTVNSVHYVGGKKVGESEYSEDAASPVKESNIKDLICSQTKHPEKIQAKDASTNEDLERLSKETSGIVFAGAAAWAGKLADCWITSSRKLPPVVMSPGPVLVVSGSLNPVAMGQINCWEKEGLASMEMNESQEGIDFARDLLVKTVSEKIDGSIKKLNKVAGNLWNKKVWDRVILNGGDTAYGFMDCIGISRVTVVKSLVPGIALTENQGEYFVLKPGGYGQSQTLVDLTRIISGR
jgi:uncharacterized protein YgbK (DUF1537 family)